MQKHCQHQNEEQWVKDRALMHTNSHTKILTVLTIDHKTLGIGVHALDDTHAPQDFPWHTIEGFLKVDKGKVERFVSGDVLPP